MARIFTGSKTQVNDLRRSAAKHGEYVLMQYIDFDRPPIIHYTGKESEIIRAACSMASKNPNEKYIPISIEELIRMQN